MKGGGVGLCTGQNVELFGSSNVYYSMKGIEDRRPGRQTGNTNVKATGGETRGGDVETREHGVALQTKGRYRHFFIHWLV